MDEERETGASYVPLATLLAESDWIVPQVPTAPGTRDLLGRAELARIKPGARIVNVANAAVVNREALIEALRAGRLGGVALDVFYQEPVPDDDELLVFDNVVLTPRMAGSPRFNGLERFRRADHDHGAGADCMKRIGLALLALLAAPHAPAKAQSDYPDRPVRLIVAFPAGSATDVVSRILAQKLSARLGQQVVVENRAGRERQHRRRHDRQGGARRLHHGPDHRRARMAWRPRSAPSCRTTRSRISRRSRWSEPRPTCW